MNEKEYRVTLSVCGLPNHDPPLRVLLRDAVERAGYRMTRGVIAVEAAQFDLAEDLVRRTAPLGSNRRGPNSR